MGKQVVEVADGALDPLAQAAMDEAKRFELGILGARALGRGGFDPRHRPFDAGQGIKGAPILHSLCHSMAGESGKGAPRTG